MTWQLALIIALAATVGALTAGFFFGFMRASIRDWQTRRKTAA